MKQGLQQKQKAALMMQPPCFVRFVNGSESSVAGNRKWESAQTLAESAKIELSFLSKYGPDSEVVKLFSNVKKIINTLSSLRGSFAYNFAKCPKYLKFYKHLETLRPFDIDQEECCCCSISHRGGVEKEVTIPSSSSSTKPLIAELLLPPPSSSVTLQSSVYDAPMCHSKSDDSLQESSDSSDTTMTQEPPDQRIQKNEQHFLPDGSEEMILEQLTKKSYDSFEQHFLPDGSEEIILEQFTKKSYDSSEQHFFPNGSKEMILEQSSEKSYDSCEQQIHHGGSEEMIVEQSSEKSYDSCEQQIHYGGSEEMILEQPSEKSYDSYKQQIRHVDFNLNNDLSEKKRHEFEYCINTPFKSPLLSENGIEMVSTEMLIEEPLLHDLEHEKKKKAKHPNNEYEFLRKVPLEILGDHSAVLEDEFNFSPNGFTIDSTSIFGSPSFCLSSPLIGAISDFELNVEEEAETHFSLHSREETATQLMVLSDLDSHAKQLEDLQSTRPNQTHKSESVPQLDDVLLENFIDIDAQLGNLLLNSSIIQIYLENRSLDASSIHAPFLASQDSICTTLLSGVQDLMSIPFE